MWSTLNIDYRKGGNDWILNKSESLEREREISGFVEGFFFLHTNHKTTI